MSHKPVLPCVLANQDVEEAIAYYLQEADKEVALGFIDGLEKAYAHIAAFPATGSLRYSYELNLPDLRAWRVADYPYLVFYREHPGHIHVWRVLHGSRDIPAWMQEAGDAE